MPDGSGGYEGFIGDLINRFVQFDGIEKFVITTGSANDVIQLPNGENVTDDIVDLGGGNDETALGRGVDIADGGDGIDGLDADLSQVAADISIDLNANTYTGVAGSSFTNFEYFTDRDNGFRTGTGNDNVVTRNADLDDSVRLGAGNDSVTVYDGTDFVVGYGLDTAPGEGGFDSSSSITAPRPPISPPTAASCRPMRTARAGTAGSRTAAAASCFSSASTGSTSPPARATTSSTISTSPTTPTTSSISAPAMTA